MAGITRTVHPQSNFFWRPLAEAAPDMNLQGGDPGNPPMALVFVDPDVETHVFVFGEDGRQALLKALTGGVIIPNGVVPIQ